MPSVVTCLLENNGKILILKRSKNVRTYKGMWGGVAGYIEKEENPIQTVLKEIREEVGLNKEDIIKKRELEPIKFTDTYNNRKYNWTIFPFLFSVKCKEKIKIDWEHSDFKWILPSRIKEFNTVPHLREIVKKFFE